MGGLTLLSSGTATAIPTGCCPSPKTIVGTSVVCADTDAGANREIPSLDLAWLLRKTDRRSQIPTPDEGLCYPYSSQERGWIEEARRLHIVGDPKTVKAGIENLAARTHADEIIISTTIHDHRKGRRSYELIAKAFALDQGEGFW